MPEEGEKLKGGGGKCGGMMTLRNVLVVLGEKEGERIENSEFRGLWGGKELVVGERARFEVQKGGLP